MFSNASPETPASFRSLLIRSQCEVSVYKRCFISWSKNRLQTSLKRHEAVPERTGRTWVRRPLTRWITLWWNWDGADRADLSHFTWLLLNCWVKSLVRLGRFGTLMRGRGADSRAHVWPHSHWRFNGTVCTSLL